VKGGIVRDFFNWGPTALYGEHYIGPRAEHESAGDVLRTLEVNPNQARELEKSVSTIWGAGVVQTLKPSSTRNYITDFYVGYRHYALDLRLLDAAGPFPRERSRISMPSWQVFGSVGASVSSRSM